MAAICKERCQEPFKESEKFDLPFHSERCSLPQYASNGRIIMEARTSMNENKKHQLIAAAWLGIKNYQGDSDPKHLENAEQYLKEVIDNYLGEQA